MALVAPVDRAFADVALLLLVAILVIGALGRLWAPARRELGIWAGITTFFHVLLILIEWVKWDLKQLFMVFHPQLNAWILDARPFGIGNLIGVVALGYVVLLVATTNDYSMKRLGASAWKFVQQRSYMLFVLTVLRAAAFVFFMQPTVPNFMRVPLVVIFFLVPLLQALAFWRTVKEQRQNRPSAGRKR